MFTIYSCNQSQHVYVDRICLNMFIERRQRNFTQTNISYRRILFHWATSVQTARALTHTHVPGRHSRTPSRDTLGSYSTHHFNFFVTHFFQLFLLFFFVMNEPNRQRLTRLVREKKHTLTINFNEIKTKWFLNTCTHFAQLKFSISVGRSIVACSRQNECGWWQNIKLQ